MQKQLYGFAVIFCILFGASEGVAQQGVDPLGDDDYGLANLFQYPAQEEEESFSKPDLTHVQSLTIDHTGHVYAQDTDGDLPFYLNSLPWAFFQSGLGAPYLDALGQTYRICVCNP